MDCNKPMIARYEIKNVRNSFEGLLVRQFTNVVYNTFVDESAKVYAKLNIKWHTMHGDSMEGYEEFVDAEIRSFMDELGKRFPIGKRYISLDGTQCLTMRPSEGYMTFYGTMKDL